MTKNFGTLAGETAMLRTEMIIKIRSIQMHEERKVQDLLINGDISIDKYLEKLDEIKEAAKKAENLINKNCDKFQDKLQADVEKLLAAC